MARELIGDVELAASAALNPDGTCRSAGFTSSHGSFASARSSTPRASLQQLQHASQNAVTQPGLLYKAALEVLQDTNIEKQTCSPQIFDNAERNSETVNRDSLLAEQGHVAQLSVLTLNVWVNKALIHVQAQIDNIRRQEPDFICLQEVFQLRVLEAYRRSFPDYELVAFGGGWTPLASAAFIALLFVPPTFVFCTIVFVIHLISTVPQFWMMLLWPCICLSHAYLFRDHYFVSFLIGNRTGLALLVRKHGFLNEMSTERITFSLPEGHAEDFLNVLRPRGFLSVTGMLRINNRTGLIPVRVVTTHLNQPPQQPAAKGRHRQVQEICDACIRDGEFFILAGDMNASPPGTQLGTICNTYEELTVHLQDAWLAKNSGDPNKDGLSWDQKENPMCQTALNSLFYGTDPLRWRCDYVFWRQSLSPQSDVRIEVRSCEMVFVGEAAVSDHYGILTVFEISANEGQSKRPFFSGV